MELRDYQIELANKCLNVLNEHKIVYLTAEVRTGKTLTSLETAKLYGAKSILFLTKKKAISSIKSDYDNFGYKSHFDILIINDESMHKIDGVFDLVIHDEHHRFAAFPKPSNGTKLFKENYGDLPMIFLSGTPHPESKMQIFHQFWVSNNHDFSKINFYKWHKLYGFIGYKFDLGYGLVTNYDSSLNTMYKYYGIMKRKVKKEDTERLNEIKEYMSIDAEKIKQAEQKLDDTISKYLVTFTQSQAGFTSEVEERILTVPMKDITYKLCNRLIKDKVIVGKDNVILADTAVKLQSKVHQLYSGTIKFENGYTKVIDYSKAEFIRDYFKGEKIGIFYKFKAEYDMLKEIFGDKLTDNIDEFDTTDKCIALQVFSGREGISLKNAKYLIFLNIDFSAVSYFQARDRLTTKDRLNNIVYWVFSKSGIEEKIYKTVQGKKDYTLSVFKKEYNIKN